MSIPVSGKSKLIWSIVLLLAGTCIYILCRKEILFVEYTTGIKEGVLYSLCQTSNPIVGFIVYSLPDALWYASLLLLLRSLSSKDRFSHAMYFLGVSLPFILEILQMESLIPGTFDIYDLLAYISTLIIIEMKILEKHILRAAQTLALSAFVAIALACASSKGIADSFPGKDNHDGTLLMESPDSINLEQFAEDVHYALSK